MTAQWRKILGRMLGVAFNGARNLYETFGYTVEVDYLLNLDRYRRQDVVSRIVNAYPDAIWARSPDIIGNDALNDALVNLDQQLSLYHYVNRADRLAGIGRYSVLMLGFDDARTVEDFSKPVGKRAKLLYVQAYGEGNAPIVKFDSDVQSPTFGMPLLYKINSTDNTDPKSGRVRPAPVDRLRGIPAFNVHRDRVIHIADCQLDSEIYGYPIIERVYNRLDDLEKVIGGSAEMFFQNGRGGLHLDIDPDVNMTPDQEETLTAEVDDYQNNIQRVLRTRGMKANILKSEGVNPGPVFNVIMSVISVATGIPQRIFIGSEQGKLASEQDRSNWAVRINERRMLYAEPKILRPLISRLQNCGALPNGGNFTVEWPDAFQMSPLERAQTGAQQARAATNIANTMVKQRRLISRREGRSILFARGELMKEGRITDVNDT